MKNSILSRFSVAIAFLQDSCKRMHSITRILQEMRLFALKISDLLGTTKNDPELWIHENWLKIQELELFVLHKLIKCRVGLLISVVLYYEKKIVPSVCRLFLHSFAKVEWTCSRFFKLQKYCPGDVECSDTPAGFFKAKSLKSFYPKYQKKLKFIVFFQENNSSKFKRFIYELSDSNKKMR